jgi:phage protein D
VSVVSRPDTLDSFSLTLVNTLPNMRWTHSSDVEIFRLGTSVKLFMGYVDELQEMIEGEITQVSPTFPASGIPTVTIQGQSLLHRLQGNMKPRSFSDVTDSEIAQQIADCNHLGSQVEHTELKYHNVTKSSHSDLEFLKQRADINHFEILVREKNLIFRKARDEEPKNSRYTLAWAQGQKAFTDANTLPLKSFNPTLNVCRIPTHVESRCYDVKSKKAFVSKAGSGDQAYKVGGEKTETAADIRQNAYQRELQHVYITTPFTSQAEIDHFTKATYNRQAMNLLGGTGETIGVAGLRAGQLVTLYGLGAFDGGYRIKEATHTLDNNGYNTSFSVNRNSASMKANS